MTNHYEQQLQFAARREQESLFTDENWMVRVNNELHSTYLPLDKDKETLRPEYHAKLLEDAEAYYLNIGDDFNTFRLRLKRGNLREAEQLAQVFLSKTEEPNFFAHYTSHPEAMDDANILELKKTYVLSDLARYKKDEELQKQAAARFITYAENQSQRDELSGYEASALGFWQARSLVTENKRADISNNCIAQFRKAAEDRAKVGDRWWESIALRQIGKISPDPADKQAALQRSEELITEYTQMGDYKKAALWARDVNDLNPSTENAQRMEDLWNENIRRMQESGNTRDIAKSLWSLFKRVRKYDSEKAEDCRLKTIEWYEKLLSEEKAKKQPREDRIRECYWVFSELIQ
ncbi:MAG: hypothetical protein WCT33_01140 [Patescibacteria group bacterium]